jgi:hypothetical protein
VPAAQLRQMTAPRVEEVPAGQALQGTPSARAANCTPPGHSSLYLPAPHSRPMGENAPWSHPYLCVARNRVREEFTERVCVGGGERVGQRRDRDT